MVVVVEAEPLRDGSWAVSIAEPSGHPFFDQRALEQIELGIQRLEDGGRDVLEILQPLELEAIFAGQKTAQQGLDDAVAEGNKLLRKFEQLYQ